MEERLAALHELRKGKVTDRRVPVNEWIAQVTEENEVLPNNRHTETPNKRLRLVVDDDENPTTK